MIRFLLDTNILSEPARPRPHAGLMAKFQWHKEEVATAALVLHELLFGVERLPPSSKRNLLNAYIDGLRASSMPVLPYDDRAAVWHAVERARLEKLGSPRPFVDTQIAAIARVNRLVLVTANSRDYLGVSGLEVENWLD